jgi:hypothetical protein
MSRLFNTFICFGALSGALLYAPLKAFHEFDGNYEVKGYGLGVIGKLFPEVSDVRYDPNGPELLSNEYRCEWFGNRVRISKNYETGVTNSYEFKNIKPPYDRGTEMSFKYGIQPGEIYKDCKRVAQKNGLRVPEMPFEK